MAFLETILSAIIFMSLFFAWAVKEDNYSLIDIAWGLVFIVIGVSSQFFAGTVESFQYIYISMISIWGIRLASFLFKRNHGKPEDPRYTKLRNEWKGPQHINGYFRVFLVQALLACIVLLPVFPIPTIKNFTYDLLFFLGILIWIIGNYFEFLGDYQKSKFKNKPENKGKICKIGLWRYTRHPNYFGEVTLWWGFWISLSNKIPLWTIIGPLLITSLILFFSGIPMAEEGKKNDPEFRKYMQETNAFFPWFTSTNKEPS